MLPKGSAPIDTSGPACDLRPMTQKSVLITGASSGIGFDAALHLQARGWKVIATTRQKADAKRLTELGLTSYVLDLENPQSLAEGAARALEMTDGKLSALFNNGAIAIPGAVSDLTPEALRKAFEINVFAQFELTRQILPAMHAAGQGRILMNSSVLGYQSLPFRGAYCATKHAMESLTDAMRMELRDSPLHIILLEPGPIPSRLRSNSRVHFRDHIDVASSYHKSTYETEVIPALMEQENAPSLFQLSPRACSKIIARALETPRPRARYHVTLMPAIVDAMRRLLPTAARDAILSRN